MPGRLVGGRFEKGIPFASASATHENKLGFRTVQITEYIIGLEITYQSADRNPHAQIVAGMSGLKSLGPGQAVLRPTASAVVKVKQGGQARVSGRDHITAVAAVAAIR